MQHKSLKQARKEAGLTQAQAAEMVHVSLRTWLNIESGKTENKAAAELFLIKVRLGGESVKNTEIAP